MTKPTATEPTFTPEEIEMIKAPWSYLQCGWPSSWSPDQEPPQEENEHPGDIEDLRALEQLPND